MKFGFIAHPTSVALKRHVKLIDLANRNFDEQSEGYHKDYWQWQNLVPFTTLDSVISKAGSRCSGIVHYMPLTAEEMLADHRNVTKRVIDGINDLQSRGAELVGLGGFTGIVGNRGLQTAEKCGIPITTGNSLTAYAAQRNLLQTMERLEVFPQGTEVAIVGYPGSISLAIAQLLADKGCRLTLVHRGKSDPEKHLSYLPSKMHSSVTLTNNIEDCYGKVQFFVAATSTGNVIDPARLLPGSVVVDAALPKDVMQATQPRSDILIIDGGLISAGPDVSFGESATNFAPKMFMNGCLAETLILTLEQRRDNFSLGRVLPPERVLEIGQLAEKHGFTTGPMATDGERITDTHFHGLYQHHREVAVPTSSSDQFQRTQTLDRFRRHINPVMADFYQFNHTERVFKHGSGCHLTDMDGTTYLDFVAGYGCLNTGHNHPKVTQALKNYLEAEHPTFVQYVSMPYHASLLAERLAELAPGDLSRVFLSNSGTEAVEAAIKMALAATRPGRLLYCDNGYHGKTLGALSITGRNKHRKAFEPLLPECQEIAFGSIEALEKELQRGDVRAFILEPIQGEGGVVLPPEGYLKEVRRLCSLHDVIMILDEVQTGLGRTGKLFCCEWEDVVPDILVLSKSLSGGSVPVGATISSPQLWDKAYGSMDRCILHTSTFGGGNLAAATALATLNVITEEKLADNAMAIGKQLQVALEEIANQYPFIKSVRGKGLMLAIEFSQSFKGSINATVQELAHRFPWDPQGTYRMLSDNAKYHMLTAIDELESSMEDMFVLRFVTKLSQEHNILTFLTANNSRVMRIQPPLVLNQQEASRFISCFDAVCRDMSTFMD
ncbi:aminotransferase class III-fold pyridoxal phosphate-dependent enzyme [Hahella ganghwensis]|uniref:aminotransferase class III-fold pyridoxal phosphate-dependent enzyme n=1 Tax=Hahella ganghwensis TaxID=286420 RepID=UPI00037263E9|nr:aminotransferase class III-fold pyridoxal phosphate-dependent enzyme [Hahella ganghwensis]